LRLTSLRQRLYLWLLLPVALLLIGLSVAGFYFARNEMARQWKASALFRMERVAHEIDMRLEHPAQAVEVVNKVAAERSLDADDWKALLGKTPGVTAVQLDHGQRRPARGHAARKMGPGAERMVPEHGPGARHAFPPHQHSPGEQPPPGRQDRPVLRGDGVRVEGPGGPDRGPS
jgi:hypothetical protein